MPGYIEGIPYPIPPSKILNYTDGLDNSIVPIIVKLNELGIRTGWSCSGLKSDHVNVSYISRDGAYLTTYLEDWSGKNLATVSRITHQWDMLIECNSHGPSLTFRPRGSATQSKESLEHAWSLLEDIVDELKPL
jgi:Tfp pilus tip-associated adhesin PilY1